MLDKKISFANRFHFTSLGCARNLVDSEVMIGLLLQRGYEIETDPKRADFLIVNTCGFLEASRQEALDILEELFSEKKLQAKVIVAGCMVRKHQDLLKQKFPNIHYLVGSGDVEKIIEAVSSSLQGESIGTAKSYLEWGEVPRMLTTPKHYGYLKIAEGCKKRCAFCIIPNIKGPLQSKSQAQVLREFDALLSQGVHEVILIAQDLGDYGKDRKEKGALASLLREFLKRDKDFWLRLLYLYPDEIDDELISIMKGDSRICPYLDMPIQHINDEILKRMHRKTSKAQVTEVIEKLRREIPEIVIRTSLMVGFPGETEEQFEELIDFIENYTLDQVGIFSFSKEKGAYAENLPDQIPEEIKQKRLQRLADKQYQLVVEANKKKVGKSFSAIIEGFHPESELLLTARHQGQCPDVDGLILINEGAEHVKSFGSIHSILITDTAGYDLVGKVVFSEEKAKKKDLLRVIS